MPKGDNFKKGGKNYITPEEARKRGKLGGKVGGLAKTPKGFAHVDVQAKAILTRKLKASDEKSDSSNGTK